MRNAAAVLGRKVASWEETQESLSKEMADEDDVEEYGMTGMEIQSAAMIE